MYRLITFLSLLIFLSLTIPATATTYYWTGSASTFWNNANNWSPAGIPGQGDRAFITAGLCRIPHGYHAHADDLYVYSSAEVIIRSNGRLYLHSPTNTPISLFGKITNKGRIYCTPGVDTLSFNIYIADTGELKQTSTGKLYCYDFQIAAIYNLGHLNNNGMIYIYGDDHGEDGIVTVVNGLFENKSSGWILLYDLTDLGLGIFSNHGNGFNNGVIKLFADDVTIGMNIEDDFSNNNHIYLDGSTLYGLRVGVGQTFTNNDYLNVVNSDGTGLMLTGALVNGPDATLYVQNCGQQLVLVYTLGLLENQGNMFLLGSSGSYSLQVINELFNEGRLYIGSTYPATLSQVYNMGIISNQSCGFFQHTGTYGDYTSAIQTTNNGLWLCTAQDVSSSHLTFSNSGVFADHYDSFSGSVSVANYGYHLSPVTGPYCINETVPNILSVGSSPVHTIGNWYLDSKYPDLAGTYDASANSFTIDPAAGGLSELYISFSSGDSCSHRIPLRFDPSIQEGIELCGDGIDNDCDGLVDEAGCLLPQPTDPGTGPELEMRTTATLSEPKLFPNPGTGMLNVELPTDYTELEIQIFSADGRLMRTLREARAATGLAPGMYLVRVRTDAQIWPVQKWIVQ